MWGYSGVGLLLWELLLWGATLVGGYSYYGGGYSDGWGYFCGAVGGYSCGCLLLWEGYSLGATLVGDYFGGVTTLLFGPLFGGVEEFMSHL